MKEAIDAAIDLGTGTLGGLTSGVIDIWGLILKSVLGMLFS